MAVRTDAYKKIKQELDNRNVILVAVSKFKSIEDIQELYDLGHRDFGENFVQELMLKYEALPKDIRWHFIGHLQTNKVKYIASFIHLVHGADSEKLLIEINKQAAKINRIIPCLLQVHISKDETKYGFDEHELEQLLSEIKAKKKTFENISITGLMGMATFTEDNDLIITEFKYLKNLFDKNVQSTTENCELSILSMGMSADYMFAVEAGSNMVRIGSLLFGSRNNPS